MILNGVAKLQTPQSKLGCDPENVEESAKNRETAFQPRQLDFCGDKVQVESSTLICKSPMKTMISSLSDDIDLKQVY